MKNTIKLLLVAVLFCSTAFADGTMTAGGKTCTGSCLIENQPIEQNTNESDDSTAIITIVRDYLFSIFN
jgi:hypothetical protein